MIKEYCQLFNDCNNEIFKVKKEDRHFSELSHFVGMRGSKYADDEIRLLVVGRAVNGWGVLNCESAEKFGEAAEKKFNETTLDWIKKDDNGFYMPSESKYYLSKSAFWRATEALWRKLTGSEEERWMDHIAWTNLFKVSRPDEGNPTEKMCKFQSDACYKILRQEIEELKPTHIVCMTGWYGWFFNDRDYGNFSSVFENPREISDESQIIEGVAEYTLESGRTVPVIVTGRPEAKRLDEFTYALLSLLSEMCSRDTAEKETSYEETADNSAEILLADEGTEGHSSANNAKTGYTQVNVINIKCDEINIINAGNSEQAFASMQRMLESAGINGASGQGRNEGTRKSSGKKSISKEEAVAQINRIVHEFIASPTSKTRECVTQEIDRLFNEIISGISTFNDQYAYNTDIAYSLVKEVDSLIMDYWKTECWGKYINEYGGYPDRNQFSELVGVSKSCYLILSHSLISCRIQDERMSVFYKHLIDIYLAILPIKGYEKKRGLFGSVKNIVSCEVSKSLKQAMGEAIDACEMHIVQLEGHRYEPAGKKNSSTGLNVSILDNPVVKATASYAMGKSVVDASKRTKSYEKMAQNPNTERYAKAQQDALNNKVVGTYPPNREVCANCAFFWAEREIDRNGKVTLRGSAGQSGKCRKSPGLKSVTSHCANWKRG